MTRPRTNRSITIALWVNAALLATIALLLIHRSDVRLPDVLPAAYAQPAAGMQPIAGGAGLFLMPAQFSPNTWGCYVMDVDRQTLVAYQFFPSDKQLRLIAARNFSFDRRLANFNTNPPPLEVKDLLDKEGQTGRVNPGE